MRASKDYSNMVESESVRRHKGSSPSLPLTKGLNINITLDGFSRLASLWLWDEQQGWCNKKDHPFPTEPPSRSSVSWEEGERVVFLLFVCLVAFFLERRYNPFANVLKNICGLCLNFSLISMIQADFSPGVSFIESFQSDNYRYKLQCQFCNKHNRNVKFD